MKNQQILSFSEKMSIESIEGGTKTKTMIEGNISVDAITNSDHCKNINDSNPDSIKAIGYKRSISLQSAKKRDRKGIVN